NWAYTWKNLPSDTVWYVSEIGYNGKDTQSAPEGYIASQTTQNSNNYDKILTNTLTTIPKTQSFVVNKVWKDSKTTHDPITVHLLADKVDTGKTITLSDDNKWTNSFTDLPTQKDGKDIDYTVSEDTPAGYTSTITKEDASDATITNTP